MAQRTYEVKISVDIPYPKTFYYRVQAQLPQTAVSRAFKLFKAECSKRGIKVWRVEVVKLV